MGVGGRMGEKVQGIRNINGRNKIERGRLRIVYETEKPKNLYVRPMDMNYGGGNAGGRAIVQWRGIKGRKKVGQL